MATNDEVAPLYSLWTIQDTLLQYYRTMFLTAESLIIAVTASVATTATAPALLLALIGLVLLFVWVRVTHARARDVSFAQELIQWHESGRRVSAPLSTFKAYQGAWSRSGSYTVTFTDGTTEDFRKDGVWPPRDCKPHQVWRWNARLHFERVLPITYLLCWVAIILYAITRSI